jgi:phosphohistidine swiveling domain-containing protein
MKNKGWISRWAGSYTFVSCSFWAEQYSKQLREILGKGLDSTIFIHKKGTVSFFVKKDELDSLGMFLSDKVIKDENGAFDMLIKLKESTDALTVMMENIRGKIPSNEEYRGFLSLFEKHLAYHNFMKKTVEYLPGGLLEKMLTSFVDARKYSEHVYSATEDFFRSLTLIISEEEGIEKELLTCLTKEELELYLAEMVLPEKCILSERFNASVIIFENGKKNILVGLDALKFEEEMFASTTDTIKGTSAFNGEAIGVARIIIDPFKEHEFNEGDILITGMTRPEFLPYIKKVGAIVTDVGGMLCHAAIIARELKIPCIIGTKNATKVIYDGDVLKLDTKNGKIEKIK